MRSSALDIFTVRSILLDIIFTIALGLVHIALFQINDPTIYLLGFYSFSVLQPKLQLCPNFWLGHVVEPFMEALDSQHRAWACNQTAPAPSLSAGTPAQGQPRSPLCASAPMGVPSYCFLCTGAFFQPCGADVLSHDKVRAKPLERTPEARPANGCGGDTLLTSCDHPGRSLGSC